MIMAVFELFSLISIVTLVNKGEDVSIWMPEKNGFMAKYVEAEENDAVETPGSLKAMAILIIFVTIFTIVCRGFVCYYLYPIAMNNQRELKYRE